MTRQERKASRQAAADVQFEAILEKAKATVKRNQEHRDKEWKRPAEMTKPAWKVACAIRVMREQGMAWWQLAYSLGLPGSADNVRQGKSGASYARRLYKTAFGELPEGVRASSKGSASRQAEIVGSFFTGEEPADTILEALAGKKIVWRIEMRDATETVWLTKEDEATLGPRGATIFEAGNGDLCVRFNSVLVSDSNPLEYWPGPERTVRVASIIQVLAGMPTGARVI